MFKLGIVVNVLLAMVVFLVSTVSWSQSNMLDGQYEHNFMYANLSLAMAIFIGREALLFVTFFWS